MTTWARRDFARTPTRGERVVDAVAELRRRARRLLDRVVELGGEQVLVDADNATAEYLRTFCSEAQVWLRDRELQRRREEVAKLLGELTPLGGAPAGIAVWPDDLPTLGAAIQRLKAEIERRRMGVRR